MDIAAALKVCLDLSWPPSLGHGQALLSTAHSPDSSLQSPLLPLLLL